MKPELFYAKILATSNQPAEKRVKGMNRIHLECMEHYLKAIKDIDDTRAAEMGADGRTVGQIVGHIMEWERYTILALGEIAASIHEPQIMHLKGYREPDGCVVNFKSTEEFNDYQARKYQATPWSEIQTKAIATALSLQGIFSTPAILPYELMEHTAPFQWRLAGGSLISLPTAWYLWIVTLEHEMVDHAQDLRI